MQLHHTHIGPIKYIWSLYELGLCHTHIRPNSNFLGLKCNGLGIRPGLIYNGPLPGSSCWISKMRGSIWKKENCIGTTLTLVMIYGPICIISINRAFLNPLLKPFSVNPIFPPPLRRRIRLFFHNRHGRRRCRSNTIVHSRR